MLSHVYLSPISDGSEHSVDNVCGQMEDLGAPIQGSEGSCGRLLRPSEPVNHHLTISSSCTTDNLYQLYQTICTICSRQPVPPSPNHLYQLYNRQSVQIVPNHLYQPHTKLSILLNISQTSLLSPNNVTIVIVAVAYI